MGELLDLAGNGEVNVLIANVDDKSAQDGGVNLPMQQPLTVSTDASPCKSRQDDRQYKAIVCHVH